MQGVLKVAFLNVYSLSKKTLLATNHYRKLRWGATEIFQILVNHDQCTFHVSELIRKFEYKLCVCVFFRARARKVFVLNLKNMHRPGCTLCLWLHSTWKITKCRIRRPVGSLSLSTPSNVHRKFLTERCANIVPKVGWNFDCYCQSTLSKPWCCSVQTSCFSSIRFAAKKLFAVLFIFTSYLNDLKMQIGYTYTSETKPTGTRLVLEQCCCSAGSKLLFHVLQKWKSITKNAYCSKLCW